MSDDAKWQLPLEEVALIKLKCEEDPRYHFMAYLFVMHALQVKIAELGEKRHISGQELLEAIRKFGLELYGPITRLVFEKWGICQTRDFGYIVFNLIELKIFGKKPDDKLEDFDNGYDFIEAFDRNVHIFRDEIIAGIPKKAFFE